MVRLFWHVLSCSVQAAAVQKNDAVQALQEKATQQQSMQQEIQVVFVCETLNTRLYFDYVQHSNGFVKL